MADVLRAREVQLPPLRLVPGLRKDLLDLALDFPGLEPLWYSNSSLLR